MSTSSITLARSSFMSVLSAGQTITADDLPLAPSLTDVATYTAETSYTELTTIFTPPPECWSGAWTLNSSTFGTMACTRAHTSSCFPSEFAGLASVLYSPAACPQGYTPGDIFTNTARKEVTSCICCPEEMTFNLDATNCQGLVTGATNVVVDNTTARHSSILGIAPLMLIAWESTDLASFTPPSAPLLQVAAKATSPGSTSANVSTTDMTSVNTEAEALPAGGLAKEARIGIGVGTACSVLLVCTLIGILIYRRRLRRSRERSGNVRQAGEAGGVGIVAKAELGGESHVVEIDSREGVAEADGTSARHELEGNWHGYEVRGT